MWLHLVIAAGRFTGWAETASPLQLRILLSFLTVFFPQLVVSLRAPSVSVSSYDKNQAYSTEWSDDEQPAAYSGNENGGNGNSFEDDSSTGKGVRVRALYDYEGQEQDELSFKAGNFSCRVDAFAFLQLTSSWLGDTSCDVFIRVSTRQIFVAT